MYLVSLLMLLMLPLIFYEDFQFCTMSLVLRKVCYHLCCRTYLAAGVSKQIQINGLVPIMATDKAMKFILMGLLKILLCMLMVHMPVTYNTLNR